MKPRSRHVNPRRTEELDHDHRKDSIQAAKTDGIMLDGSYLQRECTRVLAPIILRLTNTSAEPYGSFVGRSRCRRTAMMILIVSTHRHETRRCQRQHAVRTCAARAVCTDVDNYHRQCRYDAAPLDQLVDPHQHGPTATRHRDDQVATGHTPSAAADVVASLVPKHALCRCRR